MSGVVLRTGRLLASGKRFALATHSWVSWVSWVSWPGTIHAQRLRAFPVNSPRLPCAAKMAAFPVSGGVTCGRNKLRPSRAAISVAQERAPPSQRRIDGALRATRHTGTGSIFGSLGDLGSRPQVQKRLPLLAGIGNRPFFVQKSVKVLGTFEIQPRLDIK